MGIYYANSVCSLAVRIILHELGLAFETEAVNLKTKQTATGRDYLHINPKGSVPALQLDNREILTENAVILQYLADRYHATELLPPVGEMQRYRTLEWLNFVATDLHRYCAPLFWSRFTTETKEKVFTPILQTKLSYVDKHLSQHTFLMGPHMTLGDSYLVVIIVWLLKLNINLTDWPNVSRYYSDLKQHKSVRQALDEEGLVSF